MPIAFNVALTGLNAAAKRLEASAANISNMQSTRTRYSDGTVGGAPPTYEVVQTSLETGGVQSEIRASERPPIQLYDPQNSEANAEGFVLKPGTDFAEEATNMIVAKYDYKANLQTIKAADEMMQSLLDIQA